MKLVECPRDAMQGLTDFIPTDKKIEYINQLLKVGFDTIDFGSFVSPKAIPQMRDTADVLAGLGLDNTSSKLLSIVANERGANDAVQFDEIDYLGYPFSISETFQKRNTNSTIEESLIRLENIQNLAIQHNKEVVAYVSMAFGNPYEDEWNSEVVISWSKRLSEMGIKTLALSDTIGVADVETIQYLFKSLINELPDIEFGAHLHSTPDKIKEKFEAAYQAGCRRYDGAIKGFGGCPMAKDDLTGNMDTVVMLDYLKDQAVETGLNQEEFNKSVALASTVFPH